MNNQEEQQVILLLKEILKEIKGNRNKREAQFIIPIIFALFGLGISFWINALDKPSMLATGITATLLSIVLIFVYYFVLSRSK
jgi:hypothetical protein